MKKSVSLMLLLAMLFTTINATALANTQLSDISKHWAKSDVERAVQLGFINGYENGTFKPDNTITRAEFTKSLVAALKLPLSEKSSVFTDDNTWAEPYIQTAIENELILVDEYSNKKFEPSKNITRQEIAVMSVRTLDMQEKAEDKRIWRALFTKLTDLIQVDEKFRGYVKIANDLGIVRGYLDGSFGPTKTATRAEAVVMVLRTLDEMNDDSAVQTDRLGREIRTTNLPKNYKDYPYILASIPNEMYEMQYPTSRAGRSQTSSVLYATYPEFSGENVDLWMERVRKYYDLVLNVDYRTIDSSWETEIWEYISQGVNEDYLKKELKSYREWVETNQIVIEGWLESEPSIIYHDGWGGFHVRSNIQFEIISFKENKNLIYDSRANNVTLKKGKVYKGFSDIELGTNIGGDWGPTLKVMASASIFSNNNWSQ